MSFLGGIFTGSNPTLTGDEGQAGQIAGFGTSQGEGDIGAASAFDQNLLNGNSAEDAKLLAPEISNITGQTQQQANTIGQFGGRSGGNNSEVQAAGDKARASVNDMVSQLTGGAASQLGSLGTSTLGLGLNANQVQEEDSQQALKNQQGSILGGLISGGVAAGADALTGGASSLFSGSGDPYQALYNQQQAAGDGLQAEDPSLTEQIGQ